MSEKPCRISIDLSETLREKRCISLSSVLTVVGACQKVFENLGKARDMVEAFRVTFICFGADFGNQPGPSITIHFVDPFGKTFKRTTDFRFMGSGKPDPTEADLVEHLSDDISVHLADFLQESQIEAQEKMNKINSILASPIGS